MKKPTSFKDALTVAQAIMKGISPSTDSAFIAAHFRPAVAGDYAVNEAVVAFGSNTNVTLAVLAFALKLAHSAAVAADAPAEFVTVLASYTDLFGQKVVDDDAPSKPEPTHETSINLH